jgi:hypothetical protein
VEVRFRLRSPEEFQKQVERVGGRLVSQYAFTDTLLRHRRGGNPSGVTLRVRQYIPRGPCALLLNATVARRRRSLVFQISSLPGGKVRLYEGSARDCLRVAQALGFEPSFHVEHAQGRVWKLSGEVEVVVERILGRRGQTAVELGWWAEVAAAGSNLREAERRLRSALQGLGLDPGAGYPGGLPQAVAQALKRGRVRAGNVEPGASKPGGRRRP